MAIDSFMGKYRFLSNFHYAEITFNGWLYPTVEHAYQAAKTTDPALQEVIRLAAKPGIAKRLGKALKTKGLMRPDWQSMSLSVMELLVRQKFIRHADLRQMLLDTGDQELIEGNTWGDVFYGVCKGVGENHLGKILMKVRSELRS